MDEKKKPRTIKTFSLDVEVLEGVARMADHYNRNLSNMVETLLMKAVEEHEKNVGKK